MTQSQPAYLRIERVVKDFGSKDGGSFRAVDDVSLDILQGEIFALLGSSGCGKTTLLRMLAGFDAPSSGRITLGGQDLAGLAPYERPINMMFQSYALFPHMTVWDNIAFGLKREGLPRAEIASHTSCRVGSSSVWPWPAAWPSSPSCCCWTSPWAHWTRSCAKKPRSSWSTSSSRWA
jgi:ABC-type Fe3+/spermidine/putrescine transport system ATPase subunit